MGSNKREVAKLHSPLESCEIIMSYSVKTAIQIMLSVPMAHERTETLTGWHMFRTKTPTHMHLFSSFVSIVSKCHVTPRGCQRKDVIAYSMRHSNDSSQTHHSLAEWLEGKGKGSNEIDMWSSFLKGERFPKRSFVVSWKWLRVMWGRLCRRFVWGT